LLGNGRQFGASDNAMLHRAEELVCPCLAVLSSAIRLRIKDSIPDISV
jgi:hypothetical protein